MSGRWRNEPDVPARFARELIARLAGRQQGRITRAQLCRLGVGTSTISDWVAAHYLHPRLPGVYAVGTTAGTDESTLFEAVLYAGPDAMLSHATAAHWLGLIDDSPTRIHVSTPRRQASLPGICVHSRRAIKRTIHAGVP
jgi:predicted transcriptional regulator of viral defense system